MNSSRVDILDQRRLACVLIDRERSDAVLSPCKDGFSLEVSRAARSIGQVHEPAIRMDMDCPQRLSRPNVPGFGQGILGEQRILAPCPVFQFLKNVELVLSFQRNKNPPPGRVKIQMANLKIEPSSRCD